MTTLRTLRPGQHARILSVHGDGAIRQRLLDIGLLPVTPVRLERTAPTGNPIWIEAGGQHLSLRALEASTVEVEIL